jgi:hypothetical protein
MTNAVISALLPGLHRTLGGEFNVFDVMRHGSHEKQLSNVFAWLLDLEGTHGLGDAFQSILLARVQSQLGEAQRLGPGPYTVMQEVNTASADTGADIADIVLASTDFALVIENYVTSDGHGHHYGGYLTYGEGLASQAAVVLLCRDHDPSLQEDGWENAPVVTYEGLIEELYARVSLDSAYRESHPHAFSFIEQMHHRFGRRRATVDDRDVLDFVTAMCESGEAGRYREQSPQLAAKRFSEDLAQEALTKFTMSRQLLQSLKGQLKAHAAQVIAPQLNATRGDGFVRGVGATYQGIYQWTINFDIADADNELGEAKLQIKFGPSAWFAVEEDPHWTVRSLEGPPDYSRLFLTRAATGEIRQSSVSLREALEGLPADDRRIHDDLVAMLQGG